MSYDNEAARQAAFHRQMNEQQDRNRAAQEQQARMASQQQAQARQQSYDNMMAGFAAANRRRWAAEEEEKKRFGSGFGVAVPVPTFTRTVTTEPVHDAAWQARQQALREQDLEQSRQWEAARTERKAKRRRVILGFCKAGFVLVGSTVVMVAYGLWTGSINLETLSRSANSVAAYASAVSSGGVVDHRVGSAEMGGANAEAAVRNFIRQHHDRLMSNNVDASMADYAARVDFHGRSRTNDDIKRERAGWMKTWPTRSMSIPGNIDVRMLSDRKYGTVAEVRYAWQYVYTPHKSHSGQGVSNDVLRVAMIGGQPKIIAESTH